MTNVPNPPDAQAVLHTHQALLAALELLDDAMKVLGEFSALNEAWMEPAIEAYGGDLVIGGDGLDSAEYATFERTWGIGLLGGILQSTSELLEQPWERKPRTAPGTAARWLADFRANVDELAAAGTPFGQALAANRAGSRPARAGERCTCGRSAVVVYETARFGDVPHCGHDDGPVAA
jgi:hypothetical protein